jgi:predicted lipid-binding transport protein (Tim44 family)
MASHINDRRFKDYENPDEVKLPGPASWWPEDYKQGIRDFKPDADQANARKAYQLIVQGYGEHVPSNFARLAPSTDQLALVKRDIVPFLL